MSTRPRPPNYRLQEPVVLGLAVWLAGDVVGEHCEVIRNDRVVLLLGPDTSHLRHRFAYLARTS